MKTSTPHNFPSAIPPTKVVDSAIATVHFYDTIVVVEVKEGINLSFKTGLNLLLNGLQQLGGRPWVYISNRINCYSVNPTDYKHLNRIPTLKGIAVVHYSETGKMNTKLEANFCKKPFIVCSDLLSAYEWGRQQLIADDTSEAP